MVDLGADISTKASLPTVEIPEDYRGISFRKWLDIFLDYALCLARSGQAKASYEICEAAKDAIVFCHSREDMFLIQLCWCSEFPLMLTGSGLIPKISMCSHFER